MKTLPWRSLTMSNSLRSYINTLGNEELAEAVQKSVQTFQGQILDDWNYVSDKQVLMYGDVQAGKTSHMLGVVAQALDDGFSTIIVLTSPNTRLVGQTYTRVKAAFADVLVCNSDETGKYQENQEQTEPKPSIVVVGKIKALLDNWLQTFGITKSLAGSPVLIVDDEADATSLNTKVNEQDTSAINAQLHEIRQASTACIYLQVTATPQALLLQSPDDGWEATDYFYFAPGEDYLGGDFFFGDLGSNPTTHIFPEAEEIEEQNFRSAVITHLVTCAEFSALGKSTCNMLVHPSHKKDDHTYFRNRVETVVNDVLTHLDSASIRTEIQAVLENLGTSYPEIQSLENTIEILKTLEFSFLVVNSDEKAEEEHWSDGYNFIVGGNSLGRGLTFPFLQTTLYLRETKKPQADTVWQHARMFGYARFRPLVRLFLPANLAKMFSEVHEGNEIIKSQLRAGVPIRDLRVTLSGSINPTRRNVLSRERVDYLVGGVNYFAGDPVNPHFSSLDTELNSIVKQRGNDFLLPIKAVLKLTQQFETDPRDLDLATFRAALLHLISEQPTLPARLVVRTGRKISHGTGTLLSPSDQKISQTENVHPLLILYKVQGVNAEAEAAGRSTWSSDPIWVPSIRLPGKRQYWRAD